MWVHLAIFLLTAGIFIIWKTGRLHLEGMADKKSIQLFILVAICGNLLGLFLTATEGADIIYSRNTRIPRESSGTYTEDLQVSVDGNKAENFQVQIPEKETEENSESQEDSFTEETPEEARRKELQEVIEKYNREKADPDYYYLPDNWNGQTLQWKKKGDRSGTLLATMALFAAFAVMMKKARETQEELAKKSEQLLMDYPSLVMKFTLLVQAGMTARKAFQKIALDYLKWKPQKPRYAYEAIVTACHEMDSGVAELEAYRRFGQRCGQMKYKTFSTLLIQNLQKGSRRMADMLEQEAMEAWDERKRKARVLGEAAATKLLVPMILMMAVVMAIIMIPAFLSFYG